MQFDLEKDIAYFEPEETGETERQALEYPADWHYVAIPALYARLKQRQRELYYRSLEGQPDYNNQAIVEIIDADLYSRRPDLYR